MVGCFLIVNGKYDVIIGVLIYCCIDILSEDSWDNIVCILLNI